MQGAGIASILHRDTIAALVGGKTFERGEACLRDQRVLRVEVTAGQLRGAVKPNEDGRPDYNVRIWMHDEGMAYECTCPMGVKRIFCKHAVALALAHVEQQRAEVVNDQAVLAQALMAVPHEPLVEGLLGLARADADLADALKRLCLEILSASAP